MAAFLSKMITLQFKRSEQGWRFWNIVSTDVIDDCQTSTLGHYIIFLVSILILERK